MAWNKKNFIQIYQRQQKKQQSDEENDDDDNIYYCDKDNIR